MDNDEEKSGFPFKNMSIPYRYMYKWRNSDWIWASHRGEFRSTFWLTTPCNLLTHRTTRRHMPEDNSWHFGLRICNISTVSRLLLEEPFWRPVHVLSPNKAGDFSLQRFDINFVQDVHAWTLFSSAGSCSNYVQQFVDILNPGCRCFPSHFFFFFCRSRIAIETW